MTNIRPMDHFSEIKILVKELIKLIPISPLQVSFKKGEYIDHAYGPYQYVIKKGIMAGGIRKKNKETLHWLASENMLSFPTGYMELEHDQNEFIVALDDLQVLIIPFTAMERENEPSTELAKIKIKILHWQARDLIFWSAMYRRKKTAEVLQSIATSYIPVARLDDQTLTNYLNISKAKLVHLKNKCYATPTS